MTGSSASLRRAVGMRLEKFSLTRATASSTSWMRCIFTTEVNTIGTSSNGASLSFKAWVYSFSVLESFMNRSHLFTTSTAPLRLRRIRFQIFMSWASIPVVASIIITHTSACSMARMLRITE